uniref:Cation efflux protein transmembrane domain-containing protein n=1 Tax=Globisporangium ultimum (strain ATCC 200006 / CBS 805.95 / DAOM BR144) TaxID=431595 RepID=K3WAI3_GLOUD
MGKKSELKKALKKALTAGDEADAAVLLSAPTADRASADNGTTSYGAIPLARDTAESSDADDFAALIPREPARRSQVAHALLHKQNDLEAQQIPASASHRVQLAINASLVINVMLATAKLYAAISSGSLAVLSSLVDSILDLTSQVLFWYSDKRMHTPSVRYPAGRRRLEPIAVIISATLMGMAAVEVIQKSTETLIAGTKGNLPDLNMSALTILILCVAICVKLVLWFICSRIAKNSPSADALAQDHRNDVFSNAVAVLTSVIAHYQRDLWYLDSIGGILISLYIALSWLATGKEQVEKLAGLQADSAFIDEIYELVDVHHPLLRSDIVRAYHFGNNYLVELEVILPETMCVKDAHDISLALQHKVEALDAVERAFVHVDYAPRDYDEHKDPTIRRDSAQ